MTALRILHIITGLETGGAEMMLYKLLAAHDATVFAPSVVVLSKRGTIGARIEQLGIEVEPLHLLPDSGARNAAGMGQSFAQATKRLLQTVHERQPHLIQGWMYHGNLAATCSSIAVAPAAPVVWNIRQSLYDIKAEKRLTQVAIRLGAALSQQPQAIIYNSTASAQQHEQQGFSPAKRTMIPNGFDTEKFVPQEDAHASLCRLLGLPPDSVLIGLVGRYHSMKDHGNLVEAARWLAPQFGHVHFVLIGPDVTPDNPVLQQQIAGASVQERFHLLGEQSAIPRLMAGLDILASTSWAEAFPNVIGEAMACGVPCVVTDVGDSARVVGETGLVVPARDPKGLAGALAALILAGHSYRERLGRNARKKVLAMYTLAEVARTYESLYAMLLDGRAT